MAVYNVEKYIEEAIDSVIQQSLGFENNVQLILVDDGSNDNSANICLKFQEEYPDNILFLSRHHKGKSHVRNLGLEYAEGEYINFLDSDDKLSNNALEEVDNFFKEHESVNIVSIPLIFYPSVTKNHPLNDKFIKNNVINVFEQYNFPQLSGPSCFIRRNAIKNHTFLPNLNMAEDAVFVNKILIDEENIGFLNTTSYLYRKRKDSTLHKSEFKKYFYLDKLIYFHEELINYSLEKLGYVAKFIQYVIVYDLQWYYAKPQIKEVLSKDEYNLFMKKITKILSHIDQDIILNHEYIRSNDKKNFLLFLKNGCRFNINVKGNLVTLNTDDYLINKLNNYKLWFNNIDIEKDYLIISGNFTSNCDYKYLKVKCLKNNDMAKEIISEFNRSLSKKINCLGIDWRYVYCFDFKIPLEKNEEFDLNFIINYNENNQNANIKGHLKFEESICEDIKNTIKKDSKKIYYDSDKIIIENTSMKNKFKKVFKKRLN